MNDEFIIQTKQFILSTIPTNQTLPPTMSPLTTLASDTSHDTLCHHLVAALANHANYYNFVFFKKWFFFKIFLFQK